MDDDTIARRVKAEFGALAGELPSADHPCVWLGAMSLQVRAGSHAGSLYEQTFVVSVLFDRNQFSLERATTFARDLDARCSQGLSATERVYTLPTPTTRLEYAFALVDEHLDWCLENHIEDMQRNGERWLWCPGAERRTGWTHGDDRIVVELVAESSADERAAQELGLRWLAELPLEPGLRRLIDVVGSSH